jgi:hypothetical protein
MQSASATLLCLAALVDRWVGCDGMARAPIRAAAALSDIWSAATLLHDTFGKPAPYYASQLTVPALEANVFFSAGLRPAPIVAMATTEAGSLIGCAQILSMYK